MNIQKLILFSIGPSLLTGCVFGGTKCPDSEEFENETTEVTADNVTWTMAQEGVENVADVACEDICYTVNGATALADFSVTDCSLDIDATYFADTEVQGSSDTGATSTDETGGEIDDSVVGTVTCTGTRQYMCEGRRPLGLVERDCQYFAKAAFLEASSVIAFQELHRQLRSWDAPVDFLERIASAAKDEIRHATQMKMLAKRYNQPVPPILLSESPEDLYTVAMHNAIEGCIHETWAALEATLKANHAKTTEMRSIYTKIAQDEIKHAQLSWDLHAWFLTKLSPSQAKQIEKAQKAALLSLNESIIERLNEAPEILGLSTVSNPKGILQRFKSKLAA